jgi:hypothetical protein
MHAVPALAQLLGECVLRYRLTMHKKHILQPW